MIDTMNAYRNSLKKLGEEFLENPVNFVAEADLQARLVEILKNRIETKTCTIENPTIENIPNSYKKEYYEEIQNKLADNQSIGRVHTEVSVQKGKRFDVAVFKPEINKIHLRRPDLAGGSKRFDEHDLEAAFELKFIKNRYYVSKSKNGGEKFDRNYNKIPSDLEDLGSLREVEEKFLAIFSNFNFFFKEPTMKEKRVGKKKIIERSMGARKKLTRKALEYNVDVLYTYPGQQDPESIGYENLLL